MNQPSLYDENKPREISEVTRSNVQGQTENSLNHWYLLFSSDLSVIEFAVLYTLDWIGGRAKVTVPHIAMSNEFSDRLKGNRAAWRAIEEYVKTQYGKTYDADHISVTTAFRREQDMIRINIPTQEMVERHRRSRPSDNQTNRKSALKLLAQIITIKFSSNGDSKRSGRLTECLKRPGEDSPEDWYACLPRCFDNALDIKLTMLRETLTWTQGTTFAFKTGDTIFINKRLYTPEASEAHPMPICIQITRGTPAIPASSQRTRQPGRVCFTIYKPDPERKRVVADSFEEMTQDQFVKFLIAGPLETRNHPSETAQDSR